MPIWRLRSRSLGFRLRAATLAALLVLILVSLLASGSPAPFGGFSPGPGGDAGAMSDQGPAGGQMAATAGEEGSNSSAPVNDIDGAPGGQAFEPWQGLPGGLVASLTGSAFAPGSPGLSGENDSSSSGNESIAWNLDGSAGSSSGGGASGGQADGGGPGNAGCAMTPGAANNCVIEQLKDMMSPQTFAPDSALDVMPMSLSLPEAELPDAPSSQGTPPEKVAEAPAWLLASITLLALVVVHANAVRGRQRLYQAALATETH